MFDEDVDEDTVDSLDEDTEDGMLAQPLLPAAQSTVPEPLPEPVRKSTWKWVGSPARPEAQKEKDGVSDLFRTDFDADLEDVNDLVTVDIERDIVDAGHDGTLDDLVDVFPEDIMGVNSVGQKPSRKQLRRLRAERKAKQSQGTQQTTMGSMG